MNELGGGFLCFFFFFLHQNFCSHSEGAVNLLNLFLLKCDLHIAKSSLKIYSSMNFDTYTVTVVSPPSRTNRDYSFTMYFFVWRLWPVPWGDGQTIVWRGHELNRTWGSVLPKFREATKPLPFPTLFPPGSKISVNILRKLSSWSPRFEKMYCGLQKHPPPN